MIKLNIHSQPDDESCGPTCLHAIYSYYGLDIPLNNLVTAVERSLSGGTLAPLLGKHALLQGFDTTIYVNNLNVFDPTWFQGNESSQSFLIDKLSKQIKYKKDKNLVHTSIAYQHYLKMGGHLRFDTLSLHLLKEFFREKIPVLTGLSATYLYRSPREHYTKEGISIYDDVRGTPCGHFVVLCGYDESRRHIVVADPHRENPLSHDNYYKVSSTRLINAILLGVLTYDANILIIKPK